MGADMAGTRPPGFENPKPEVLRLQPQIPRPRVIDREGGEPVGSEPVASATG